jgi:hypothetical protein
MKNCNCITGETINYGSLLLTINECGLHLSYDAYSVDSSFDKTINISYCPFCGIEISDIPKLKEELKEELKKKLEIKRIKREREEQERLLEISKQNKINEENRLKELYEKYNPNEYILDGNKETVYLGFNKKEIRNRLKSQGVECSIKRISCIKVMTEK